MSTLQSHRLPAMEDVIKAYEIVKNYAHCTPVLTSKSVNAILKADIYFKCENFQKGGAFKFRGASNAVFSLTADDAKRGVVTHSSGNHAAGLALAASIRGIPSYIVMPENAAAIKKKAVEGYGGKITFCKPTLKDREDTLYQVQMRTGAVFIHAYDNIKVICGQGTASLELLDEYPDLDIVTVPVGGGGLLSGTLTYTKGFNDAIKVYGTEPLNADDAFRSLRDKTIYPSVNPNTIADGLRTSLCELTYTIIAAKCDGILTVTEEGIVEAMRIIWERMKILIEPSSAVPIAAMMEHPQYFAGKKVGTIISGGNVDLGDLPFKK
ncbi:MAG: pyridoxal-phosphate dependent enzyme [Deltaproteobacteria bacterium]|nr:pyridoxal-phosphate dependent enzyme [Deltaproteobacteria bacterium]